MTITLPLQPQEEAQLLAVARAKGLTADALVREALDRFLAEQTPPAPTRQEGKRDTRPVWDVITESMKDVPTEDLALLPKDGASQIDHYIYGWPKRDQ
jgi:hypothetical protein